MLFCYFADNLFEAADLKIVINRLPVCARADGKFTERQGSLALHTIPPGRCHFSFSALEERRATSRSIAPRARS